MKLILQAIKSLLNKLHIRLAKLEDKTSDENIADGKFLPAGVPYVENIQVSYLGESTYSSAYAGFPFPGKLELTAGMFYDVTINGEKYNCKCGEQETGKYLNEPGVFDLAALNEPFGGVWVYLKPYNDWPSSVTLSVEGVSKVPHKMDAMLIPDGYVTPLVVTCREDDIPDHTRDEAVEAVEAGRDVVIFRIDNFGTISVYKLSWNRYDELYFYSNYFDGSTPTTLFMREARWKSSGLVFTDKLFTLTT